MTLLCPGTRVKIVADPGGFIPNWMLGALATVTRITAAGVSLHVEGYGEWRSRYVPLRDAERCLKVIRP